MTHKGMRDYVQATLGLQDIASYDETPLVTRFLNEGVIDLLSRTRCVVRCINLQVAANESTYILDHRLLGLRDWRPPRERARRDESRSPSFTLVRSDVLLIDPAPTEDGALSVWAIKRPDPMADDGDSPGAEALSAIPDEYQDSIVLYALWKGADYADDATAGQGERYRIQYEGQDMRSGRLAQIKMLVNKRGTAMAPRARSELRLVTPRSAWVG
jgi:hypothetical protein